MKTICSFRSSGSAVYNITMVARGAADCYLEFGCHAWDMAAGATIIKEAGGVIMDPSGKIIDPVSVLHYYQILQVLSIIVKV